MAPSIGMRMDLGIGPGMAEPDYDEEWFASVLDIMARSSEKQVDDHARNTSLLKQLLNEGVEFRRSDNIYFLDSGRLVDKYFIHCRYIAAEVGSTKVDIRFLGTIDRESIDSILNEFEVENSVELEASAKRVPRTRMTYLSVSTKDSRKEIARVFKGKLSFVHNKMRNGPEAYSLGKSLVARIAAESHRRGTVKPASEVGYSEYSGPMYFRIPGWFRKNYAGGIIDAMHSFFQGKDTEKMVENPVGEGEIKSGAMIKEASKKPGCYYIDSKFKKRHVKYFFMDTNGAVALKLDCNIDIPAIETRAKKPIEYFIGGQWVSPDRISEGVIRSIYESGMSFKTRIPDGNHLLVGTEYSGMNLNLKGNCLYADGHKKPLIRFSEKMVRLRPFADYSPEERQIAVLAANAVYEQMLYKTSSTITRKGTTACLMDDELAVIKEVNARVKEYMEESGGSKYSYANALRLATMDIIESEKEKLKAEVLKHYGLVKEEGINDGAKNA